MHIVSTTTATHAFFDIQHTFYSKKESPFRLKTSSYREYYSKIKVQQQLPHEFLVVGFYKTLLKDENSLFPVCAFSTGRTSLSGPLIAVNGWFQNNAPFSMLVLSPRSHIKVLV